MEPVSADNNHSLNIQDLLAVVCGGPMPRLPGRDHKLVFLQHLWLDLPLYLTFGFTPTQ